MIPEHDRDALRLGFGCMRLPVLADEGGGGQDEPIDLEHAAQMADEFMASGFCYFDTARGYHGGASEGALKRILVDRYPREDYLLASKLPAYLAKDARHARKMFDISLEDTQAGYFDCFLLQNLGDWRTERFDTFGIWEYLEEKKRQGLIRYLGFSFHDSAEALAALLKAHGPVDFVQLQINYADWGSESVQSCSCYEVARSYGLPVVVMEPLKGGLLAEPPEQIGQALGKLEGQCSQASSGSGVSNPQAHGQSGARHSPVSLALRFAASLEGVTTVLSGMSTLEQVRQNTVVMRDFEPLDEVERRMLAKAGEMLDDLALIPCTFCGYCRNVCPEQVKIPEVLRALNTVQVYGDTTKARESYLWTHDGKASSCAACGACELVCPQGIRVRAALKRGAEIFEGHKDG